ncbi:adaptor protein MecA [Roseburia hominis]|uniref:adaptor protein MecA n=1 Tax=Roseburia hominis TaxID=301301 RepID=UPI001F35B413|nr:adaptor protein MecA [Roseburia hominis]
MRFKRVDKSTVRCIVSQDEIEERGLKIEDLIRNGDKAQEFLNEVVDMAEEEIGFKMTSGIQAVQAAFLPNHDIVFTFSDNAKSMGMDQAIDQLKDLLSEDVTLKDSNYVEISEESVEPEGKTDALGERLITIFFRSLDATCTFCKRFPGFAFPMERLYKCEQKYALILDTADLGKEEMEAIRLQAAEYAQSIVMSGFRAYDIMEHQKCLIAQNAVQCLQTL